MFKCIFRRHAAIELLIYLTVLEMSSYIFYKRYSLNLRTTSDQKPFILNTFLLY